MRTIREKLDAALALYRAILDTVRECGQDGAPSGVLYAALSARGCSLEQWQRIEANMIAGGLLRKQGHLLFVEE